jgi:hypothetical protein
MEKHKIQIFCQGKKLKKKKSVILKLMQLLGSTNKKYILAQTPAETTKHYFHKN